MSLPGVSDVGGDYGEVRAAIADFCGRHTPEDFGLPRSGYFKLRKEKHASARWDPDEVAKGRWIGTDFGDHMPGGGWRKFDLFDVHVVVKRNGDKRAAIADLMQEWRQTHPRQSSDSAHAALEGQSPLTEDAPLSDDDHLVAEARGLLSQDEHHAARVVAERVSDPKRRSALLDEVVDMAWSYNQRMRWARGQ